MEAVDGVGVRRLDGFAYSSLFAWTNTLFSTASISLVFFGAGGSAAVFETWVCWLATFGEAGRSSSVSELSYWDSSFFPLAMAFLAFSTFSFAKCAVLGARAMHACITHAFMLFFHSTMETSIRRLPSCLPISFCFLALPGFLFWPTFSNNTVDAAWLLNSLHCKSSTSVMIWIQSSRLFQSPRLDPMAKFQLPNVRLFFRENQETGSSSSNGSKWEGHSLSPSLFAISLSVGHWNSKG